MSTLALDPKLALPPGLTHADAEKAAVRFATLEVVDLDRPNPLRLRRAIPRAMNLGYRGGLRYRGRPTHIWRFRLEADVPHSTHHLLGVRAKQVYYAAYPAMIITLPYSRRGELQDWLDSLGPRGIGGDEAGAFMFLLEALDEMGV